MNGLVIKFFFYGQLYYLGDIFKGHHNICGLPVEEVKIVVDEFLVRMSKMLAFA